MSPQPGYIRHLHAFRGFAILNIVGAHAWSFMIFWTGSLDSTALKGIFYTTETLFHGATLYFAIISGLLFSRVLQDRGWHAFFKSKTVNVLFPYVLLSLAFTALFWQFAAERNTNAGFPETLADNLVSGGAAIQFWYMPVLFVLFALTPLLARIQRSAPWLFWLLILAPLVVSRSAFPDFLRPQSFVYFTGAYALGMWLGSHYERVQTWLTEHLKWLALAAIVTTAALFGLYLIDYRPEGFYSVRQTLVYVQKVAICLLVLHWFSIREARLPGWLFVLGSYAFAIYFLHVEFMALAIDTWRPWLETARPASLIGLFGTLNFVAAIAGSLLLAFVVKKIAGRHSRKLVGA